MASSCYPELLDRAPDSKPKSFAFGTTAQRDFAIKAMKNLIELVDQWQEADQTFDRGTVTDKGRSPRPKPVLRTMPPGSNDPLTERPGV